MRQGSSQAAEPRALGEGKSVSFWSQFLGLAGPEGRGGSRVGTELRPPDAAWEKGSSGVGGNVTVVPC